MSFWDSEKQVADVEKAGTKNTFYRVKEVVKNGRKYVDVREHYTKKDGTVQYTTKGTAVPVESLGELVAVLTALAEGGEQS